MKNDSDFKCPRCDSGNYKLDGTYKLKSGKIKQRIICRDCGKGYNNSTEKEFKQLYDVQAQKIANLELSNSRLSAQAKNEKNRNKEYIFKIEVLEKRNDFLLGINDEYDKTPLTLGANNKTHEATPIALLSDIHVEEKVDPETVEGLNEYNPDIAEKRLNKYFQNLLDLINKERKDVKIKNLVLALLGDNITGYIHEELKENNYMSPTEATIFIKALIIRGIKFLSEYGNFERIIVP